MSNRLLHFIGMKGYGAPALTVFRKWFSKQDLAASIPVAELVQKGAELSTEQANCLNAVTATYEQQGVIIALGVQCSA